MSIPLTNLHKLPARFPSAPTHGELALLQEQREAAMLVCLGFPLGQGNEWLVALLRLQSCCLQCFLQLLPHSAPPLPQGLVRPPCIIRLADVLEGLTGLINSHYTQYMVCYSERISIKIIKGKGYMGAKSKRKQVQESK